MNEIPPGYGTQSNPIRTEVSQQAMIDDLGLYALQAGPATSSKVARFLGITNIEAKAMLRRLSNSGYVKEFEESGSRLFRLVTPEEMNIVLDD